MAGNQLRVAGTALAVLEEAPKSRIKQMILTTQMEMVPKLVSAVVMIMIEYRITI